MGTQGSFGPSSGPSLNLVLPMSPTGYDWGIGSVLGDTAWGHWNPFGRDRSHPTNHTHLGQYTRARPAIPFTFKEGYQGEGWVRHKWWYGSCWRLHPLAS